MPPMFPVPPPPPTGFAPPPPPSNFIPPPPPPGFFPRKRPGPSQDPLSNIPHRTLQGHPSLPPKPGSAKSDAISSATISAEPELRNLKKESTAFMPTSVKRKRATATPKVNAAPSVETTEEVGPVAPRPDLLSTLHDQFGPAPPEPVAKKTRTGTKDDYAKFVEEMGDIL